jgi:hypothetical protein
MDGGVMVRLRKVSAGVYATLDGRYQIERSDGTTECDHPLCYQLHERYRDKNDCHWIGYGAWIIWDTVVDDYAEGGSWNEYDTKREAHQALTAFLARQS